MAKIKVSIIDQSTLRLEEDAKKGDTIDLHELQSVDTALILDAINAKKDETYKALLAKEIEQQEVKAQLLLTAESKKFNDELVKKEHERLMLLNQIDALTSTIENEKKLAVSDVINKKDKELGDIVSKKEQEIQTLKVQLSNFDTQSKLVLDAEKTKVRQELENKLHEKEKELGSLKFDIERHKTREQEIMRQLEQERKNLLEQMKNKELVHKAELENKELELSLKYQEEIRQKDSELSQLRFAKSTLQIKMLGEELERWCNNEYEAHSLVGFEDCKWYKDNKVVRETQEEKGTKADYIFEVYKDTHKRPEDLLVRVVLEMKNESPDTKVKKKNSDYYKKLYDDMIKKEGHYALLVSELEWDSANDSPIKKVTQYNNMYVVRPAYFIAFLALIKSLANKYQMLLIEKHKESETFKTSEDILKDFEDFKNTYLDKPLKGLEDDAKTIRTHAQKAYDASYKIIEITDHMINQRIENIKTKIERFDIRKISRRVQKLED